MLAYCLGGRPTCPANRRSNCRTLNPALLAASLTRNPVGSRNNRFATTATKSTTSASGLRSRKSLAISNSCLKTRRVAELLFDLRQAWTDDRPCVVSAVREFGHRRAKEPVKTRRVELDGEYVEVTAQHEFDSVICARAHHNRAWSEVVDARLALANEVSLSKIEFQEHIRARGKRVDDRGAANARFSLLKAADAVAKRRCRRGSMELHSRRLRSKRNPSCVTSAISLFYHQDNLDPNAAPAPVTSAGLRRQLGAAPPRGATQG